MTLILPSRQVTLQLSHILKEIEISNGKYSAHTVNMNFAVTFASKIWFEEFDFEVYFGSDFDSPNSLFQFDQIRWLNLILDQRLLVISYQS